jgi:AraC-type DNA-binding domain-containing proteins
MEKNYYDFFGRTINNINMEVLEHGFYAGDESWKYYNVTSTFNRLYFIIDGEGFVENAQVRTVLKPGYMYLVPLHTTNNYICDHYIRKFYIHFNARLFEGYDIFEQALYCIRLSYDEDSLDELIKNVGSSDIADIISCKSFLIGVISRFLRQIPESSSKRIGILYKYSEVFKYIRENCFATLTAHQVSENIKTLEPGFEKAFRQDTGHTLKNCIDNFIMQAAKERLLLTNSSVKEISYSLKFNDEFYFSHFFKKYAGVSPKVYRKTNKI